MAKKSTRSKRTSSAGRPKTGTSGRQPVKKKVEELRATPFKTDDSGVIEFDPDTFRASAAAMEAENLQAEPSDSVLEIPDEFYDARDELMAWLGGHSALTSVRSSAVAAGQRFGLENVLGVGIGVKESSGSITGELAVKVLVREKVSERRVSSESAIPPELGGLPTDIEPTGALASFSYAQRFPRPVISGVSCGHPDITAGTIGCLVVLKNNRLALLSNNHVLANENNAAIGDPIIQPGRLDGGVEEDLIGVLEAFESISFSGTNEIDGAVAWTSHSRVSAEHVTYVLNPSPTAASPLMNVIKNGRTTQATTGWISAIDVDGVGVEYDGGIATFDNQILIRSLNSNPFSQGGDSGSLIVTSGTKRPVGLLFAGSSSHTIANPIATVMARLGIDRFVAP